MKKYLWIFRSNFKRNVWHYLLLFFVFILSVGSIVLAIDFKDKAYANVYTQLEKACSNIHINVSSIDNKQFTINKNVEDILNNANEVSCYSKVLTLDIDYIGEKEKLMGFNVKQFENFNISLAEKSLTPRENGIYICKKTAKLYDLKIDSEIKIKVDGKREYQFSIQGIANNSSLFLQNNDPFLMDYDWLANEQDLNLNNKASSLFIRAKTFEKINCLYDNLFKIFSNEESIRVTKVFDPHHYAFYVEPVGIGTTIFSIFSILTSTTLCYFVFKYLIKCRTKKIGVLKSIGFSKKELFISVFVEASFIILITWILGVWAGWGLLSVVSSSLTGFAIQIFSVKSCFISLGILALITYLTSFMTNRNILKKDTVSLIKGNDEGEDTYENKLTK